MSDTSADQAELDRFTWKGLRFNRVEAKQGVVLRFECEDFTYGGRVEMYANGQWTASFTAGLGAIEWSKERALERALLKHIDHLYYRVEHFEDLLRRP